MYEILTDVGTTSVSMPVKRMLTTTRFPRVGKRIDGLDRKTGERWATTEVVGVWRICHDPNTDGSIWHLALTASGSFYAVASKS